jgi:hypothetical protein
MNRVADKLREQTGKLKKIRQKTDKVVDPYIDARDECRAGATSSSRLTCAEATSSAAC